ncbi:MAG: geranylgeranylglyceryl/heptaprenylglyceryl phosphate synthase [Candidatus Micrarchaeia archaeon]
MRIGKVEQYLLDKIEAKKAILSIVIDPVDYPSPDAAIKTGISAAEAGADIIAIGGSIGAQGELLDNVTKEIKSHISVPVILFPGNVGTITRYADAIYFLTLINSRNPYWLGQAQMLGAPLLRQFNIESIPTAYIVVEPGGTVGWVGDAKLIPRNKPKIAAALAMTGELAGNHMVFTDAGSASEMGPIPIEMVRYVRKATTLPYMVAGGIRKFEEAREIIRAGADMVQIGTAVENASDIKYRVETFKKAVDDAIKSRVV